MPWKNGGGETTEIAVHPAGSGLDDFDWRVSMATVNESGPFSAFEGVDRTLTVLEGAGIVLSVAGQPPVTLTRKSAPLRFAADAPTRAGLVDGPIIDLNVMTRRGKLTHRVSRMQLQEDLQVEAADGPRLLLVQSGKMRVWSEGNTVEAGPLDAVLGQGEAFRVEGNGEVHLIEIDEPKAR